MNDPLIEAIQATQRCGQHATRAVQLLQPVFAPVDIAGPSTEDRRAALCAALEANAQAEAELDAFLRHAAEHAAKVRAALHASNAAMVEQDAIIVAWEQGIRDELAANRPNGIA